MDIAYLMYECGLHSKSTYKKRTATADASTSTSLGNLKSGLKKMGYKLPDDFYLYDFNIVKSSIINGRPVIASGFSHKNTFLGITTSFENGHFWLIDGVRKMSYKETLADGSEYLLINQDFVFCNVGWGSSRNKWYLSGIFDFRYGNQSYVDRSSGKNYYYKYDKKILPNVYY